MKRRVIFGVVVCAMLVAAVGMVLAQPQGGGRQRGGAADGQPGVRQRGEGQTPPGGRAGFGGMRDPEQMRQMMDERMRTQLGATEEEWKLIGPRLQKVMELSRDATSVGRGMFFGMGPGGRGGMAGPGGRPGGDQGNVPQRELSPVEKATEALQTVLQNESATPDLIKTALTALRTAREKAKQDLAKAQQELRQLLTVKQEAMLVLMGTLN